MFGNPPTMDILSFTFGFVDVVQEREMILKYKIFNSIAKCKWKCLKSFNKQASKAYPVSDAMPSPYICLFFSLTDRWQNLLALGANWKSLVC